VLSAALVGRVPLIHRGVPRLVASVQVSCAACKYVAVVSPDG
jgi:hypothetical protein